MVHCAYTSFVNHLSLFLRKNLHSYTLNDKSLAKVPPYLEKKAIVFNRGIYILSFNFRDDIGDKLNNLAKQISVCESSKRETAI